MAKEENNPYKPILEIAKGNEVLRIHKNTERYFLIFGAELDGLSNLYEMSLTDQDIENIKKSFK